MCISGFRKTTSSIFLFIKLPNCSGIMAKVLRYNYNQKRSYRLDAVVLPSHTIGPFVEVKVRAKDTPSVPEIQRNLT